MNVPAGMMNRLRNSDCQSLIAQWEQPFPWREKVLPMIPHFPFPCLLYVGEADAYYAGMKVCAEGMPRAQFVPIPNYGHFDIFSYPESIVPFVRRFLAEGVAQY